MDQSINQNKNNIEALDKITIIIPCRNEEKFIRDCLDSVINNDYPKDKMEVFVVDGKSSDKTPEITKEYSLKYNYIHLITNDKKTVPNAMNLGIEASSGEYIIRLDAHSEYPENYFSELISWSKKLKADNIGALWKTEVKIKSPKANAIKKVLSTKLGVGNSYFRIGSNKVQEVDTVPFGCFKRDVFDKIGLFDHRLTRNQDIELNKRIKRSKGKIYLLSDLHATYYARETYWEIAKNNFSTGMWNVLTVFVTKYFNSLSFRHFVPFIFILSLILPLIFMFWISISGIISLISLLSYFIAIIFQSAKLKDDSTSFAYILIAFITLHFSYGLGSLLGLFRLNFLVKK